MPAGSSQYRAKKKVGVKDIFREKAKALLLKYNKCMIVTSENVGSRQLALIRRDLDGKATVLYGKNSLMRLVVRELAEGDGAQRPELKGLMPELRQGAALVFADCPFADIRDVLQKHCIGSPAKVGAISPVEIVIHAQRTLMPPTQVNILHALNIQSKINKGTIEITSEKLLVRPGDKVGASEANLLKVLGILPFKYGVKIRRIYDSGRVYDPEVLDIGENVLAGKFAQALSAVAALSVAIGFANEASAPHLIGAAFRQIAAVAVAAEIPVAQIADIQALLSDPEALAQAQAAAAAAVQAQPVASEQQEAAPDEEKKAEEEVADVQLGFDMDDLFG